MAATRWPQGGRVGLGALTSFVGRGQDVGRVLAAVRASRLVTLTGSGGIGKTRVALRALAEVSSYDAVVVVELASVRSDQAVAQAVLERMGISPSGAAEPIDQLVQIIGGSRLLLLLDNCEHVLAGTRHLVHLLLGRAPGLRVLATSRESLGIAGEQVVRLLPLPAPDPAEAARLTVAAAGGFPSVRLLVERAAASIEGFALDDDNVAALAAICARLDGVPLAIELAATRLRSMSAGDLLERLDRRFDLLTRGDPTALPHHRTLRQMVAWSWDLCSPGEQRLWARLAVFAGGADFEGVRAVCAVESASAASVHDDIDGLVDKSVLVVDADPEGTPTRYVMLETLVDFGRERLVEAGDEDSVAARHARHFQELARRGSRGFLSAEQHAWARRLARDRANLVVAFERLLDTHADEGLAAVALAVDLHFTWFTSSLPAGVDALARSLARCRPDSPVRVAALIWGAFLLVGVRDLAGGASWAGRAVREAAALEDPAWVRRAAVAAALADLFAGAVVPADPAVDGLLAGLEADGDAEWTLIPRAGAALVLLRAGDYTGTRRQADRMRRSSARLGESWFGAWADGLAATAAWMQGDDAGAEAEARRAFVVQQGFPDRRLAISMTLLVLAGLAGEGGDEQRTARLLGAAAGARQRAGVQTPSWGRAVDERMAAVTSATRVALGDETFLRLEAEGWSLPVAELRDLVLDPGRSARDGPVPAARDGPVPGPLTARELEVATLVAQGLTNRRIAGQLVLSTRTVDGHLERILGKLGFHSRVQVAAWIIARGDEADGSSR